MERIKQAPEYYDRMYEFGGYGGTYDLHYRHSSYLPLFRGMLTELRRARVTSVLEVGCGTALSPRCCWKENPSPIQASTSALWPLRRRAVGLGGKMNSSSATR